MYWTVVCGIIWKYCDFQYRIMLFCNFIKTKSKSVCVSDLPLPPAMPEVSTRLACLPSDFTGRRWCDGKLTCQSIATFYGDVYLVYQQQWGVDLYDRIGLSVVVIGTAIEGGSSSIWWNQETAHAHASTNVAYPPIDWKIVCGHNWISQIIQSCIWNTLWDCLLELTKFVSK